MVTDRGASTRKARTDAKVFRAALDLLRSAGPQAVTVESVAARSGVAKTTIYRRHADRVALLTSTLDHYLPPIDPAPSGPPRQMLTELAESLVTTIEDYVGLSGAAVMASRDDPATAVVLERVIQPRIDLVTRRLEEWKRAGSLDAGLDVELTLATIVGAVVVTYSRFGHFPADWPVRLVDHLWPALAPRPEQRA